MRFVSGTGYAARTLSHAICGTTVSRMPRPMATASRGGELS